MPNDNVSAIITTYNRANIVPRAIRSALDACEDGDEILVVDDCSTDNTQQVVSEFGDKINYIRLEQNSGISAARNAAIDASSNSLIAYLDDDDEWIPQNFILRKRLMQAHPELIYTFSNFSTRYSNGRIARNCLFNWGQEITDWEKIIGKGVRYSSIADLPDGIEDFDVYIGSLYRSQMNDDHVLPSTLVVRRELAGESVYFDASTRYLESWPYSSKLARIAPVAYLDISTTWQNQYDVPRLTDAPSLKRFSAHIRTLENQWGKDTDFLAEHGEAFQNRLDIERRKRIRELLAHGKTREAREDINKVKTGVPMLHKAISLFPSPVLGAIMGLRSRLK